MQGTIALAEAPAVPGAARQQLPLNIALTVKKIVRAHGEDRRIDASRAEPGDVLEYRAVYENVGNATLKELSAILPLPEHTTLVVDSPDPINPEASNRSAKDRYSPLSLHPSKGKAAAVNHYGALRWRVAKLAPKESFSVSARVVVDSVTAKDLPNVPLNVQAGPSILQ